MAHCDTCNRSFYSPSGLKAHNKSIHPKDFNLCWVCNIVRSSHLTLSLLTDTLLLQGFITQARLRKHQVAIHSLCFKCNKTFENGSDLETHSFEHTDRPILCTGRECIRRFKSAAGLVAHLESGACRAKFKREHVNHIAVDLDKTNVVTNPARLVQGADGPIPPPRAVTSPATALSFNGDGFECSLCHREFVTLAALNDHIASPTHDEKMYRCPKEWAGCGKEFSALSILCHHVEGKKCGIRRFNDPMQQVISTMSSALKGNLVL
ncbi:hypothetical protein IEO21_09011 [Rhodonia placenta]|uniref:C2H2-type domain-containing protein n=1 Tax=Rhodonia placenta TaxID=104341 RepID=A0A8H7TYA2_9APHY|nr:hypothetical protein IEO21_09011 [Postia placenta]